MKTRGKNRVLATLMFGFVGVLGGLVACGPTGQSSLLTDAASDAGTHTLDKTPSSNALYLSSNSVNMSVPFAMSKVEVSGECFVSTYTGHYIYATFNGSTIGVVDLQAPLTAASQNKATCKNGRFNLAVNINGWARGIYLINLQLVAYNSPATLVTNDVRGAFSFNLTKY